MKNSLLSFVAITFFIALTSISCTKQNDALITQQPLQDFRTDIVGSWQLAQKGVEVAMHEGHVCTYPQNMAADKITYVVKWENTTMDEKRDFNSSGDYNCYWAKQLSCKGTYKISNEGDLDINSNCQNNTVKIAGLTTIFLTVKDGNNYFKYRKIN